MIVDTDRIKKSTFRNLVIALFVSFAYDVFWLVVSAGAYRKDDTGADGGMEKSVRSFSLMMSVISFFFRVSLFRCFKFIKIVYCYSRFLEGFNRFLENHKEKRSNESICMIFDYLTKSFYTFKLTIYIFYFI